ncbi:MAG: hypothetical protein K9W44_06965 [Candidatus Lokiarchaeota archaeon]|nr:hypothetical protein [Candidatus Harpocratesius repetitus]
MYNPENPDHNEDKSKANLHVGKTQNNDLEQYSDRFSNLEKSRKQTGNTLIKTYIPSSSNSQDYQRLRNQYSGITRKNQIIQIIGAIFTILTLLIEYIIYRLAKRMNYLLERIQLLRFVGIFIILFLISILAVIQFIVIFKWNQLSKKTSEFSLTRTHFHIINQIQFIRILIGMTIFLLIYFFIIYRNYIHLPTTHQFLRIFLIYKTLLRLSALLCLIYLGFELGQFIIWSKRLRMINHIEQQIIHDLPNMDELSKLLEDPNL